MDIQEALYTTRAMRRVKPDPIPEDVQMRIMDAAIRAPSGGNAQNWRFLLVDDPEVRGALAPIYQGVMATVWGSVYRDRIEAAEATPTNAITNTTAEDSNRSNCRTNVFSRTHG